MIDVRHPLFRCQWAWAVAVLFFGLVAEVRGWDDWPRWNGPAFEMISPERGWQKDWNAHPPKELWSAELGTGFSSVSVVGERVYSMGRNEDNDVVYCLNANSGNILWRHEYPCKLLANMHAGGPGSTPTVQDNRVFTFSREGHTFCLDAETGSVIWEVFLPDITGIKHPSWGFTSSAVVVGDKVILESGRLVALNKNDGSLIWQTEKRSPGYGSAIQFVHNDRSLLATLNNDGLLIVDENDGAEVAFTEWATNWDTNSTTPIYFDGKFFISTGYGKGCAAYGFDGSTLTQIYTSRDMSNHMNNSVIFEGNIYGIHGNSNVSRNCQLVCLNAETGEKRWSIKGVGCGSLMLSDGYLIVLTDKGALTCGKADPMAFNAMGKLEPVTGLCWTVPVLAHNRIYCRNANGRLVCLQLERETEVSLNSK